MVGGQLVRGVSNATGELAFLPFDPSPFDQESLRSGAFERGVASIGIMERRTQSRLRHRGLDLSCSKTYCLGSGFYIDPISPDYDVKAIFANEPPLQPPHFGSSKSRRHR